VVVSADYLASPKMKLWIGFRNNIWKKEGGENFKNKGTGD
jgi:hypothetical protein